MQTAKAPKRPTRSLAKVSRDQFLKLYNDLHDDEEISRILEVGIVSIRSTRSSMFLPPLRSAKGRIFTPQDDQEVLHLRDKKGIPFSQIATMLNCTSNEIETRYRLLNRLAEKAAKPKDVKIPCIRCGSPFLSHDRKTHRFCDACRKKVPIYDSPLAF